MVDKKQSQNKISASRGAYDYSKRYLGNIADDYVMVTNKKEHKDCIGIKGGKYDGVIYKYGKVATVEDASNNTLPATLKFNYNITLIINISSIHSFCIKFHRNIPIFI